MIHSYVPGICVSIQSAWMDSVTGPWVDCKGRKLTWQETNATTDTSEVEGSSRSPVSVVDALWVLTVEMKITWACPGIYGRPRDQDLPRTMSKSHWSFVLDIGPILLLKWRWEVMGQKISGLSNCHQAVFYWGFHVLCLPVAFFFL